MSFNELTKTMDRIEDSSSQGIFDISSMLLPEDEVVKNILIMEDNISEEEADLMVNGFVSNDTENSGRKKSKSEEDIDSLKGQGDTDYKNKLIEDSVDESKSSVSETDTGAPLSSKSPYHQRARRILSLIKEKIKQFFRKVRELLKEIGAVTISIISSIPGAALMIAPFAFNVPGMITMIMQMIQLISMLLSKFSDLTSFFKYFRQLPLVLTPTDLNRVSSLISSSYGSVNNAFKPLEKSIDNFNSASKSTIESRTNNERYARRVTSRLRKLKYIDWKNVSSLSQVPEFKYVIDENFENVNEDDIDEIEDILESWEVVFLENRRVAVRRKKILDADGNEVKIDDLLNKLNGLVSDIKQTLPSIGLDDNVIYDVRFEDGTNLFGLTKQDVDGLKTTYNVIYSENVKYSFIVNE